jgi:LuxR family maltose regulon positive regulatory protein
MQLAKIEEARLLLKQNRLDETLALVERYLLEDVEPLSLDTLRMGIIQSLAYFKKKDEARALKVLKQLLDLAEPENMVASFTREGASMEKLLRLALVKSIHPEFVHRLLTALEAKHKLITVTAAETLIEPLSERELEILQILNGPLSIPEIARQLFVSPNTVRTHIKNIYGKLGVHGRSSAVRKAKELRLL